MIFTCINNIPDFFACVAGCSGDVFFMDQGGNARDLKDFARNAQGCEFLLGGQLKGIEVRAVRPEDSRRLIRHMIEMMRS